MIYKRYLQAFKKGVYNYIKEDIDPTTQENVPRKYFSGGWDAEKIGVTLQKATPNQAMGSIKAEMNSDKAMKIAVNIDAASKSITNSVLKVNGDLAMISQTSRLDAQNRFQNDFGIKNVLSVLRFVTKKNDIILSNIVSYEFKKVPTIGSSVYIITIKLNNAPEETTFYIKRSYIDSQELKFMRRAAEIGRGPEALFVSEGNEDQSSFKLDHFVVMRHEGESILGLGLDGRMTVAIAMDAGLALAELFKTGIDHRDILRDHVWVKLNPDGTPHVFFIDYDNSASYEGFVRNELSKNGLHGLKLAFEKFSDWGDLKHKIKKLADQQEALNNEHLPVPYEIVAALQYGFDKGFMENDKVPAFKLDSISDKKSWRIAMRSFEKYTKEADVQFSNGDLIKSEQLYQLAAEIGKACPNFPGELLDANKREMARIKRLLKPIAAIDDPKYFLKIIAAIHPGYLEEYQIVHSVSSGDLSTVLLRPVDKVSKKPIEYKDGYIFALKRTRDQYQVVALAVGSYKICRPLEYRFSKDDLNPQEFLKAFQKNRKIDDYLRNKINPELFEESFSKYLGGGLFAKIIDILNDRNFYYKVIDDSFDKNSLEDEVQVLLKRAIKKDAYLGDDDFRRLNTALLEAFYYPNAITKSHKISGKAFEVETMRTLDKGHGWMQKSIELLLEKNIIDSWEYDHYSIPIRSVENMHDRSSNDGRFQVGPNNNIRKRVNDEPSDILTERIFGSDTAIRNTLTRAIDQYSQRFGLQAEPWQQEQKNRIKVINKDRLPKVMMMLVLQFYRGLRLGAYTINDTYPEGDSQKLWQEINGETRGGRIINRPEGPWLYRSVKFRNEDDEKTHGSLNIRITRSSVLALDTLIMDGTLKGYFKIANPSAEDKYRHDSVTVYFYENPSLEVVKRLSQIAQKYYRGDHLLGKSIVPGFSISEIGSIDMQSVRSLCHFLGTINPFIGAAFGQVFNKNMMSEGQFHALKEVLEFFKINISYDRNHGFTLTKEGKDLKEIIKVNQAMTATGGIDLTTANNVLQTQNGNGEIAFHMNPVMIAQLQNALGFVPVIINIQPMVNLKAFLGLNDSNPSQTTSV